ncbi:MAG: aspartate aminotransferase, partial [Verrucomicrobiales bacterium]|nr:aspartate aminotransferase [Verrucomicrobiales bacterium]
RAGYLAAPKAVIKAVSNLTSHIASNPCNIVQYAAIAAFEPDNDTFVACNRKQLASQRQTAIELLQKIPNLPFVTPDGAFYLFPDVSSLFGKNCKGQPIADVDALAEMLLEHAHIAIVPGSAFGSPNHVRISYAIPTKEIVTGLTAFAKFVESLS